MGIAINFRTFFAIILIIALQSRLQAQGKLIVTFLDVGQGDSAVIQTPQDKFYIIDAGLNNLSFGGNFDAGRDVVVPFLKAQRANKVNAAVNSHPHLDHYGGFFSVLNAVPVLEWIDSGFKTDSKIYLRLIDKLSELGVPRRQVQSGDLLDWDANIQTEVLWPPDSATLKLLNFSKKGFVNNHSIVLMVQYKKVSFLFAGDIEEDGEQALLQEVLKRRKYLKATILKMPHHGSKTSAAPEFLDASTPQLIVISCGRNNNYGHPHEIILNRMRSLGLSWKQTSKDGSVKVVTDGEKYQVYTSTFGFRHQ